MIPEIVEVALIAGLFSAIAMKKRETSLCQYQSKYLSHEVV